MNTQQVQQMVAAYFPGHERECRELRDLPVDSQTAKFLNEQLWPLRHHHPVTAFVCHGRQVNEVPRELLLVDCEVPSHSPSLTMRLCMFEHDNQLVVARVTGATDKDQAIIVGVVLPPLTEAGEVSRAAALSKLAEDLSHSSRH